MDVFKIDHDIKLLVLCLIGFKVGGFGVGVCRPVGLCELGGLCVIVQLIHNERPCVHKYISMSGGPLFSSPHTHTDTHTHTHTHTHTQVSVIWEDSVFQ